VHGASPQTGLNKQGLYNCTHILYFSTLGSGELLEKVGESGPSAVTTTPEYNLLRENYDKIVSILTG